MSNIVVTIGNPHQVSTSSRAVSLGSVKEDLGEILEGVIQNKAKGGKLLGKNCLSLINGHDVEARVKKVRTDPVISMLFSCFETVFEDQFSSYFDEDDVEADGYAEFRVAVRKVYDIDLVPETCQYLIDFFQGN